jgi:Ca-activated chloride channel family protein
MDFQLNHIEALHWLWAVVAASGLIALGLALRRRDLGRFADDALLGRLLAGVRPGRRLLRGALRIAAMLLLAAALLDPRYGTVYERVEQRGVDLVVLLDVSKSMLAEDAKPNRLERARQYIGDLVQALGGDRVALIAFAGVPELKCPLTIDHGAFRLALAAADPAGAPRGGSLLGDAIRFAGQAFTDRVPDHKAIVIFSDGEDQGSEPVEAARVLHEEIAVPIYTVGIGDTVDGARIPLAAPGGRQYLTSEGQEVWSKMNASLLRDVALASGGAFIPVGTGTVDMGRLYADRIEPIAGRAFDPVTLRRRTPRFQWLAGLGLVLLLAEGLVGDRKRRSDEATKRRRGGKLLPAAAGLALAAVVMVAAGDAGALREAGRALAEKRYDEALALYGKAQELDPQSAEIPYNMGVAAYRKGDLGAAAGYFDQARMLAADPALRARAAYNLGTTAYRKSIQEPQGDPQAQAAMQQAGKELEQAIDRFREAIDADPADMDARVNGELAWRWLEQLKEMQQEQEQQQQQQDQDEQQQQQQEEQQGQQQRQGEQQQQQQQQQPQQQQEQQQHEQQQAEGQQGQPEQGQESQEQEASAEESGQEQQAQAADEEDRESPRESADRRPMTRGEAERLLQGVRDRQRQRQEELARQRNARKPPVAKDW